MDILQNADWCLAEPDIYFINEFDLDHSTTEKILRNKFYDPLISSDSEEESSPTKINWDEIFNKNKIERQFRFTVQGAHPLPNYPKLSALTGLQHFQCLKVLCSQNPDVIPGQHFPRPTKLDQKVFEEVKEIYAKEQKEFVEWAKYLWVSNHCVRALRPKPTVEMVYEAEFKVRAKAMQSFPKNYTMAAQIPLESPTSKCEIVHQKEIIKVNVSSLAQVQYPDMTKKINITRTCPVPEPCNKHPTRFMLPMDTAVTLLPLTEVHGELAQFAFDNGAPNIASESALRCLVQQDRYWTLPVSVCRVYSADGEVSNVVVLGNEFPMKRDVSTVRTHKAYRRMLEYTLVTAEQKRDHREQGTNDVEEMCDLAQDLDLTLSDDDGDGLVIDTDFFSDVVKSPARNATPMSPRSSGSVTDDSPKMKESPAPLQNRRVTRQSSRDAEANKIDFYECTCKDTLFEKPPPRSYRRFRVRSYEDYHDIIVHTPHRLKGDTGEVILEPIPEYQIECGACQQTQDQIRASALALLLRKNATVLNVRIDSLTGDIVKTEPMYPEELNRRLLDVTDNIANRLHTTLEQLQGLVPGRYLLYHEPSHGPNALLYTSKVSGRAQQLTLAMDCSLPFEPDEAKSLKTSPTLAPLLLPMHKFRKMLPLAFTPFPHQVAKEPKKPPTKNKTPARALQPDDPPGGAQRKWPKKKKRKGGKKNTQ